MAEDLIGTGKILYLKIIAILAIFFASMLTFIIFRFADRINRILGLTAALLVSRIMGLLLASIAANFILLLRRS